MVFSDNYLLGVLFILLAFIFSFAIAKLSKKKKQLNSKSTVLITGGCMGIGREIALLFASNHKCNVIIYDVRADLADVLLKEIQTVGGKGEFYECDISNKEIVAKTFASTLKKFPDIDILINNAGIVFGKPFDGYSDGQVEKIIGVNFLGPYFLTREVLSGMKKRNSGHIATVASITAHIYNPDVAAYCASKAALFNLFSSLRLELKREKSNIKTTIICPWAINSGMFEGFKVAFSFFGLLDFLRTKDVAKNIYDGIMSEKEEVYLPFYQQIVFRILLMLPSWFSDPLNLLLGKDAMKDYVGRDKKKE